VDECSSGQHRCHNSTICVNTVGSYMCRCGPGWKPKPGLQNNKNTTVCEEVPFPTWTPPTGISSQTLSHFFDQVKALGGTFKPGSADSTLQNLVKLVDELMEAPGDLKDLSPPTRHRVATQLLSGLEDTLRFLAKTLTAGPFTYHSPSDTGPTLVGLLSSRNMGVLLEDASLELDPEKLAELKDTHDVSDLRVRPSLLSAVNSVFLSNNNTESLASHVTFAFSHLESPGGEQVTNPPHGPCSHVPSQELVCAFWKRDKNGSGHWATKGCWKRGSQNGSTTCQCNHLSSFAILVAHYDVKDASLALITKVGLTLSLVCLLLCIFTFLLVRPIQGSRTTIHLHLCICLFVGSTIFLAGIENDGHQ
ncbi:CD97 antigen-like, partial [Carlito syrichta]|uniref:CD97 antigen-like n=1 Tax=Carlito syrichta TaxID=1868482 RepID=A0A1U7U772_CARSF